MIKFWSKFLITILWYNFTRDNRFLVTPSHENKETLPPVPLNRSRPFFFPLDSELSNGKMKVQVKRTFKGYFFVTKKTIRKCTGSAWNFLQPSLQVCRGAYIPYFKINDPIFYCFTFFEECLNPQVRVYKMLNKHTLDYHPSPAEFTSSIHPLIFLWNPKGFISPEYFLIFFSNLYIPLWLKKCFEFMVLRLLVIHLWVKELNLFISTHAPKQNSPPGFYHHYSRQKEITHFPQTKFFENPFFPQQRGRGLWSWKYYQS